MKDRRGAALRALLLGVWGAVAVSLAYVFTFSTVLDELRGGGVLDAVALFGLLAGTGPAVVVGIVGLRSTRRWMAVLGIVLGVLSIVGLAIGVFHPWLAE